MAKQYDTFIDDLTTLPEGKEIVLAVRNVEDYKTIAVQATVSSVGEDGALLWLRYSRGRLRDKPWRIDIKQELPFESLFSENSGLK